VSNVATGLPVLDHLLALLARAGSFDLALEIEPDEPGAEVDAAGDALGRAVAPLLLPGAHGEGTMPSAEALAMVVLEASGTSLVASNADLTGAGGLGTDRRTVPARPREAAHLTLHVRLIEGEDTTTCSRPFSRRSALRFAAPSPPLQPTDREEMPRWRSPSFAPRPRPRPSRAPRTTRRSSPETSSL
jgi:hypothetical protein